MLPTPSPPSVTPTGEKTLDPVSLGFSRNSFSSPLVSSGSKSLISGVFFDCLRLRYGVDSLIPHSAWQRRAGTSWSMVDLGSGVKVFARVQESTPVELVNGSALWSLTLEGKDFASKLGFGPFDPLPAAACVSVMESAFDYLQHYGMLATSDVFATGRVNRLDVTVDLDPGLNDVSAFLHVFADSFPLHKSRRFSDGGVTDGGDGVGSMRRSYYLPTTE